MHTTMRDLKTYKAFIFDLDNTLYNYDYCENVAYEAVFKWIDKKRKVNDLKFVLLKIKHQVKSVNNTCRNRLVYFQHLAKYLKFENHIEAAFKMYKIYNKVFYKNMIPFLWVKDFFKNHKCFICTDMISQVQFEKLVKLGLDKYVIGITTSEEVGVEKPNKKIYKNIFDKVLLSCDKKIDKKDILFIGDSEKCDIEGPREFGFKAILVKDFEDVLYEYSNW